MKYPHIVCINGNWIPAGTEIPDVKDKDFSKVSKVVEYIIHMLLQKKVYIC